MSSPCRADRAAPGGPSSQRKLGSPCLSGTRAGNKRDSSFRWNDGLWVAVCALLLAGCDRETRDYRGRPLPETGPFGGDPRGAAYERNAWHLAQGARLFAWMNCTGCHAHGGGGMGPPLMDDEWRYGGSMEQIAKTILDGRPNGMPAFRGRITEQQAWQLAAWVRAQSMQPSQDLLPGRADELSNTEPLSLDERRPIRRTTAKADDRSEE